MNFKTKWTGYTAHHPQALLFLLEWSHSVEQEQSYKDQPEDDRYVLRIHIFLLPCRALGRLCGKSLNPKVCLRNPAPLP